MDLGIVVLMNLWTVEKRDRGVKGRRRETYGRAGFVRCW